MKKKLFKNILGLIVILCLFVFPGCCLADEALFVSGGSAELIFLPTGQRTGNNLGPPQAAVFRASYQGRLAMVTMNGEWRLISPFRNLPFNQWPPFKKATLPTRYKSKDKPEPLQWSPDGLKFLIRLNREITIHHAGGGPLITITQIPDRSSSREADMQWGNDSGHLVFFDIPTCTYYLAALPQSNISWEQLGRSNPVRLFQLDQTSASYVHCFHFSPDTRQVAFVHERSSGTEFWAGPIAQPSRLDGDSHTDQSGWDAQQTTHSSYEEVPEILPLGWSQDSKRFYYYFCKRTSRVVRPRMQDETRQEQLIASEIRVYDIAAGRTSKVMDVSWTPWIVNRKGYPQPVVSEDGRYLVFWGVDNTSYRSKTSLKIHMDMLERTSEAVDLVCVDLTAKTASSLARKRMQDVPYAAFIKTQAGDDTNPREAYEEPQPHLPQYFLRLTSPVQTEVFCGTRVLAMHFEGKSHLLPLNRDTLRVRATFWNEEKQVKDLDGTFCTSDGYVANFIYMNHDAIMIEEDHFRATMYTPLNDLDWVADSDTTFTVVLELLEGDRVLVKAEPVPVVVPAEWMPRVWFKEISAISTVDQEGQPVLQAKATVFFYNLANQDIIIEAIVRTADYQDIVVRDASYRVTENRAGGSILYRPVQKEEWQSILITIPLWALQLAPGSHSLAVNLRVVTEQDRCFGDTRPQFVTVTIAN